MRLASSMALSPTAWARADASSSLPLIFTRFASDPLFSLAYYTRTSSSSVSISGATCAVNSLMATTHFWACVRSAPTTLLFFSISPVLATQYRPRSFWQLGPFFVMSVLGHLRCRTLVCRSSQGLEGLLELLSWCRCSFGNCRCFLDNFCDLWERSQLLILCAGFVEQFCERWVERAPLCQCRHHFFCPPFGTVCSTFHVQHVPHSHHPRGCRPLVQRSTTGAHVESRFTSPTPNVSHHLQDDSLSSGPSHLFSIPLMGRDVSHQKNTM